MTGTFARLRKPRVSAERWSRHTHGKANYVAEMIETTMPGIGRGELFARSNVENQISQRCLQAVQCKVEAVKGDDSDTDCGALDLMVSKKVSVGYAEQLTRSVSRGSQSPCPPPKRSTNALATGSVNARPRPLMTKRTVAATIQYLLRYFDSEESEMAPIKG